MCLQMLWEFNQIVIILIAALISVLIISIAIISVVVWYFKQKLKLLSKEIELKKQNEDIVRLLKNLYTNKLNLTSNDDQSSNCNSGN